MRGTGADRLAVVGDLLLAELGGPAAERRTGTARVDHDEREAGVVHQVAGSAVDTRRRPVIAGGAYHRAHRCLRDPRDQQPDVAASRAQSLVGTCTA